MMNTQPVITNNDPETSIAKNYGADNLRDRLQALAHLEDGWLNGEGKALSATGLAKVETAFDKYFSSRLPLPYLFPTFEGNLQAEWIINEVNVSLDINLANLSAFYHASDTSTEMIDTTTFNLAQQFGWQQLVQKLTILSQH